MVKGDWLRLCHLSAAQGYTRAFNSVAECHESGWGIAADASEAIRWYRRAEAAGDYDAADRLQELDYSRHLQATSTRATRASHAAFTLRDE